MRSRKIILVISLCLLVLGAGFIFKVVYTRGDKKADTEDAAIQEEARKLVKPPVLPVLPKGREVTTNVTRQIVVNVPLIKWQRERVGIGSISIPRTVVQKNTVTTNVTVTNFVGASSSDVAKWHNDVAAAQSNYQAEVNEKVTELVKEKNKKEASDREQAITGVITNTVIPLITGVTGLLGAITTLYGMRKRKPGRARGGSGG